MVPIGCVVIDIWDGYAAPMGCVVIDIWDGYAAAIGCVVIDIWDGYAAPPIGAAIDACVCIGPGIGLVICCV